jgi:hypothetical protein
MLIVPTCYLSHGLVKIMSVWVAFCEASKAKQEAEIGQATRDRCDEIRAKLVDIKAGQERARHIPGDVDRVWRKIKPHHVVPWPL